jgi:dCMP deaminase
MKDKHIKIRVEQCLALAKASNCPRRKFGALLLDPERNVILIDGYNGGARGGGALCGGDVCWRDTMEIPSGTHVEVGCHHAEMNVICNAAANGVVCKGAWLIVTGEPCTMCAKLIHHAGIARVLVVEGGYVGANGVKYLTDHGVEVQCVQGPKDPRGAVGALEAAGLTIDTPSGNTPDGSQTPSGKDSDVEKPLYEHDCDECVFLGRYEGTPRRPVRVHDLYYCQKSAHATDSKWPATVIARHSNTPSDYTSGIALAQAYERRGELSHPLVMAFQRAQERKLL